VPADCGGNDFASPELLEGYEGLAAGCLTTTFLLSQREAACRRIRDADNEELRNELLPALARGDCFATVGLSQLTTSRQHTRPSLMARLEGGRVLLNGVMPWVTGAPYADYFVTGAVVDDGRQVLAVVPGKHPGVTVGPPLNLMALRGSLTAEVVCRDVALDPRWVLAGPAEQVMAGKGGGTGGLETSCLALGLAGAAADYLNAEAARRPELVETAAALSQTRQHLRQEMLTLARSGVKGTEAVALRARANRLVLRVTQAALTAGKGTAFVRPHPAQRWARQAMFFLVWSCPRPAAEATLAFLAQCE
jgi:alkylation response protein AidB-like acyl-CoA dehydrogenase